MYAYLKSTLSVVPARRQSITAAASYELQRRFEANGAEAIAVAASYPPRDGCVLETPRVYWP